MAFRGVVVGCGFFARNHLYAWNGLSHTRIVAVCDIDIGKARETAARFNIGAHYESAQDMLEREKPDFVDIVTTPPTHRRLVELAVADGRVVICQKPIADSYHDAVSMVEAARAVNATLMIHENFRWQLPFVEIGSRLRAGLIGPVRFARISFRHGFNNYRNQPYLAEIERFAIMDVGLHLYDLARHLVGEVQAVSCRTQKRNPIVRGEDAFTALLGHVGGASTIVDCSYHSVIDPEPFPQTTAWIEGDDGTLELDASYQLIHHGRAGRRSFDVQPPPPAWAAKPWHAIQDSVAAFNGHVVDVLSGRAQPQPSGAHNLRTLATALASYESADSGQAVDIDRWIEANSPRYG